MDKEELFFFTLSSPVTEEVTEEVAEEAAEEAIKAAKGTKIIPQQSKKALMNMLMFLSMQMM